MNVRQIGLLLAGAVLQQASITKRRLGFGWHPANVAPSTMEELRDEYSSCRAAGLGAGFRVWSGGSDLTVYGSPEANYAFRFWHDITHVEAGLGLTFHEELATAQLQINQLGGLPERAIDLFRIDTQGQTHYADITGGEFPDDQLGFAAELLPLMRWHRDNLRQLVGNYIDKHKA